jgi:hypothetical protein
MENALRRELRAADLLGLGLEHVDDLRPAGAPARSRAHSNVHAKSRPRRVPGDVAVPEIAFPSRRCNKTGHNQQ